jgi:hypothetical protein
MILTKCQSKTMAAAAAWLIAYGNKTTGAANVSDN